MCVRERKRKRGSRRESEGERKESEKRELNLRDSARVRPLGTTGPDQSLDILAIARSARRERKREKERAPCAQPMCSRDASPPVRTNDVRARARAWMVNERREI